MIHLVHRYDVVRVKVAVEADSHEEAMKKADELLAKHNPVRPTQHVPGGVIEEREWLGRYKENLPVVLGVEHADEVTGYLVDELGDEEYEKTRSYGADFRPDDFEPKGPSRG